MYPARVMTVHPNSLANLKPPWTQGHSGNRNGRPNSGGSLLEYVDELMAESEPGIGVYSLEELEALTQDQRVSRPKAIAANLIVLASKPGFHTKSGRPYCAVLVDMILDRKVGKPVQAVIVHKTETRDPHEIGVDIAETLAALITVSPNHLVEALALMEPADRLAVAALLPVDTTAVVIEPDEPE